MHRWKRTYTDTDTSGGKGKYRHMHKITGTKQVNRHFHAHTGRETDHTSILQTRGTNVKQKQKGKS